METLNAITPLMIYLLKYIQVPQSLKVVLVNHIASVARRGGFHYVSLLDKVPLHSFCK